MDFLDLIFWDKETSGRLGQIAATIANFYFSVFPLMGMISKDASIGSSATYSSLS